MNQNDEKTSIIFFDNGPIQVKGAVKISGQYGEKETESAIFLCRCGESKKKPYCDGSHKAIEFKG